jgi:hypothetical protein
MSVPCVTFGFSAPRAEHLSGDQQPSLNNQGRDLPRRAIDRVWFGSLAGWRDPGLIDSLGKRLRKRLPPPLE